MFFFSIIFNPTTDSFSNNVSNNEVVNDFEFPKTSTQAFNVCITEIYADGSTGEWIEIYNPTGGAIDFTGWTIEDGSGSTEASLTPLGLVSAGEVITIGDASAIPSTNYTDEITLTDAGDDLILKDDSGYIQDAVIYGSGGGITGSHYNTWYWQSASGAPAPDDPGESIERINITLGGELEDNNIPSDWVLITTPTPGNLPQTSPPELTLGSVVPITADQSNQYNFSVTYTDRDNQAPIYMYVYINETQFSMVKQNPLDFNYTDGCLYMYLTFFQPANYEYYFKCSDGCYTNTTSIYSDLTVTLTNSNVPDLQNAQVNPTTGDNTTIYSFTVLYVDDDNNFPSFVNLTLNTSSTFEMVRDDLLDNNAMDGLLFYYNTTLDYGNYSFKINCSDGVFTDDTGWIIGPEVVSITGTDYIYQKHPDQPSYDSNDAVNLSLYYYETIGSAPISGASITIEVDGMSYMTLIYDYGNGYYNITIDWTDIEFSGYGPFNIRINISKALYENSSIVDTLTVFGQTSLSSTYPPNNSNFTATDIFDLEVYFEDTIKAVGVPSASIVYEVFGSNYTSAVTDLGNGYYNITFNCSDSMFDLGYHFDIEIFALKPYHYNQSIIFSINITTQAIFTNLRLDNINKTIEKYIEFPHNEILTVRIRYQENETSDAIESATVNLTGQNIFCYLVEISPGEYFIGLNTTELNIGLNNLTISAQAAGFTLETINFTINVTERETNYDLYLNSSVITSITLENNQFVNITFIYNDFNTLAFIDGAVVQLKNNTIILDTLTENIILEQYELILNASEVGVGVHNLTIYAYKENFTAIYVNITVNITAPPDIYPPINPSIIINSGDFYTNESSVTLTLYAEDNSSIEMSFKNESESWSPWKPYNTNKVWELSAGEGNKTVWVMFRDAICLSETNPINDTIILIDTTTIFLNETGVNIENLTSSIGVYIEMNISDICYFDYQRQTQRFAEVTEPPEFSAFNYYSFDVYDSDYQINDSIFENATIRIYYNPGDINDLQKLALLKYLGGGSWTEITFTINVTSNYIEFFTTSFSYYVLGEVQTSTSNGGNDPPVDNSFLIIVIIIIGSVAALSSGGVYKVRKNKIQTKLDDIKDKEDVSEKELVSTMPNAAAIAAAKRERLLQVDLEGSEVIPPEDLTPIPIDKKEKESPTQIEKVPASDPHKKPLPHKKITKPPEETPILDLDDEDRKEIEQTESEIDIEEKEILCIVHKGPIVGAIYLCPKCKTYYCQKCALVLKEQGEHCWSCENEIELAAPTKEVPKIQQKIENLEKRIDSIKQTLKDLDENYAEGELSEEDYNIMKKPLADKISDLEKVLEELKT